MSSERFHKLVLEIFKISHVYLIKKMFKDNLTMLLFRLMVLVLILEYLTIERERNIIIINTSIAEPPRMVFWMS